MHHALELLPMEILLKVFGNFHPSRVKKDDRSSATSTLAVLARTCHTFKEPALDVLWSDLNDLSPLSRCLPDISYSGRLNFPVKILYGFRRPLEEAEWGVLLSYTYRIGCIREFGGLDWNTLGALVPRTESLFPNLRSVYCQDYFTGVMTQWHPPIPCLTVLSVMLWNTSDSRAFQGALRSFARFSPNIRELSIHEEEPDPTSSEIVSQCICSWKNLETVQCPAITLDVAAFTHLSGMPALTRLAFSSPPSLAVDIVPSDITFPFSSLQSLDLRSTSLESTSRLLSRLLLPAITDFTVSIDILRVPRQEFKLFLDSVQTVMGQTIQGWSLIQPCNFDRTSTTPRPHLPWSLLRLDDLRPFMSYRNLHRIAIDLDWNVDLTESNILELASAWPELEALLINQEWGWNTRGGITPDGLAKLLKTHPSLNSIALAIDTRGFAESHPEHTPPVIDPSRLKIPFSIDAVDSEIEEESVPAIAAFLAGIIPRVHVTCAAWYGGGVRWLPNTRTYCERWEDVFDRAYKAIMAARISSDIP